MALHLTQAYPQGSEQLALSALPQLVESVCYETITMNSQQEIKIAQMLRFRRVIVPFKASCVAACNVAVEQLFVHMRCFVCFSGAVSVTLYGQVKVLLPNLPHA